MRISRIVFLSLFMSLTMACAAISPTPLLMGTMADLNEDVHDLYLDCSDGANYVPTQADCKPAKLERKVIELLDVSEEFIFADIKQPQGYDIHLAATMILFRISERNAHEYSRAEQIARQFFEIQQSTYGDSLDVARFYWPWFTSANSSFQHYHMPEELDAPRKVDMIAAASEGADLMTRLEGPRAARLQTALFVLNALLSRIEDAP